MGDVRREEQRLDKSIFKAWELGWIPTANDPPCIPVHKLSLQQRQILGIINSHICQAPEEQTKNPLLMLVTGMAGTGKSLLCHHVKYLLQTQCVKDTSFSFLMCAYTGVAAFNIKGTTLHSSLGLPILAKEEDLDQTIRDIKIRSKVADRIGRLKLILIDEFSFVGSRNFFVIDQILRKYDPSHGQTPFASRSVVLLGDIFQISPVCDSILFNPEPRSKFPWSAKGHQLYKLFTQVFVLKTTFRQAGDEKGQAEFRDFLERVRKGETTQTDINYLRSRLHYKLNQEERKRFRLSLHVFPYRVQVAEHNEKMLREEFKAEEIVSIPNGDEHLNLARGCPVMLLYNINIPWGLCNGSCGFVRDIIYNKFESATIPLCILVDFPQYKGVHYYTTNSGAKGIPVFKYNTFNQRTQCFENSTKELFPLRLSYGLTIHKVMGLTLESIAIHLGAQENSAGMDYVALSRVRALKDLMILDDWIYDSRLKYDGKKSRLRRFEEKRLIALEKECNATNISPFVLNRAVGFHHKM